MCQPPTLLRAQSNNKSNKLGAHGLGLDFTILAGLVSFINLSRQRYDLGKSVLCIKSRLEFSVQVSFEIFFAPTNIKRVTLEMRAGTRVRLHAQSPVLLWDFNPLKTEFLLHNNYKFSSYLTGNTLCLRYKAEPVNAVWGNSRCLL
jgi:hypothetical protein